MSGNAPAGVVPPAIPARQPVLRSQYGTHSSPRLGIIINGTRMDDLVLGVSVTNNNFFSSDNFRAELRLDETPRFAFGPPFWSKQDQIEIEILTGDRAPTTSIMVGRVDDIEFDYNQRVISLAGRDFTADLIDAKTTENWPNRTSSEIAEDLARRHNLKAFVTQTTTKSGIYYQREHVRLADESSEWSILTYLAEHEGFDVYVKGRELHFGPPATSGTAVRWALAYKPPQAGSPPDSDSNGFRLRRSLTVARDVVVRVISWNSKKKFAIEQVARATRAQRGSLGGSRPPAQTYVYRLPGLTEEQALQEAQARLKEITRHERSIEADLPGDERLTTRHILSLTGTGTDFDQDYRIDSITRRISFDEGSRMSVRGRLFAPASTAVV